MRDPPRTHLPIRDPRPTLYPRGTPEKLRWATDWPKPLATGVRSGCYGNAISAKMESHTHTYAHSTRTSQMHTTSLTFSCTYTRFLQLCAFYRREAIDGRSQLCTNCTKVYSCYSGCTSVYISST